MGVLDKLEPAGVFHYFEEICQIPHPSYHEKAISDYLVNFAKEHELEYYQDKLYNVIMIKEASEGYENEEPIILQGHMDMVCEKEPGCSKNMDTEGLDLEIDGDYIQARGTTLGGDDGIAVAYALALLSDETLRHPRLEFLCTVCEEVGMNGADAVDTSPLKGHLLLNMDSETEGEVLASCAGGGSANIVLPIHRDEYQGTPVLVHIDGLSGGHSGTEINKGHASSTQLLVRLLREASMDLSLRLLSFDSGSKDNAIPRESHAVVCVKDVNGLKALVKDFEAAVLNEYSATEPELRILIESPKTLCGVSPQTNPLNKESTQTVLALISALPNGVQRMSDDIPGLVETSLNLGIATLNDDTLNLRSSVRSSVGSAYQGLTKKIHYICTYFGADCRMTGEYPAWEYVKESPLREKMSRIYKDMFGNELNIEAIHAGVECGLLAGKIENLDAISMGPDILDIHTPAERLSISSTQRMYDYIVRIIEEHA